MGIGRERHDIDKACNYFIWSNEQWSCDRNVTKPFASFSLSSCFRRVTGTREWPTHFFGIRNLPRASIGKRRRATESFRRTFFVIPQRLYPFVSVSLAPRSSYFPSNTIAYYSSNKLGPFYFVHVVKIFFIQTWKL